MEKTLNPRTKKAQILVAQYKSATMSDIYDLYNRPSMAKIKAFERCKDLMKEMRGYNMRVIGGNCDTFSCGCIAFHKGEKGVLYFTAYNTYFVPFMED